MTVREMMRHVVCLLVLMVCCAYGGVSADQPSTELGRSVVEAAPRVLEQSDFYPGMSGHADGVSSGKPAVGFNPGQPGVVNRPETKSLPSDSHHNPAFPLTTCPQIGNNKGQVFGGIPGANGVSCDPGVPGSVGAVAGPPGGISGGQSTSAGAVLGTTGVSSENLKEHTAPGVFADPKFAANRQVTLRSKFDNFSQPPKVNVKPGDYIIRYYPEAPTATKNTSGKPEPKTVPVLDVDPKLGDSLNLTLQSQPDGGVASQRKVKGKPSLGAGLKPGVGLNTANAGDAPGITPAEQPKQFNPKFPGVPEAILNVGGAPTIARNRGSGPIPPPTPEVSQRNEDVSGPTNTHHEENNNQAENIEAPAQSESTKVTSNAPTKVTSPAMPTILQPPTPAKSETKPPKKRKADSSSSMSSVWVRVPLLIVVTLACILVC
ncbi:uncharacterized protein TM35_000901060 [Trypanosoma theileri]|uniref:Mucin-associated surface protein (MASP) n=1 Tax=Trypanosoma theileri TaxID=67003 RepID=A0A1X0NG40_9TRYP|nr:uncharacterized protein TM35_000901060 [Trypanosoma theileri]ORC82508.1 hypothetical protein TM35_000901060 [Trypanosoma theileri]